jgi:hypothetical protein
VDLTKVDLTKVDLTKVDLTKVDLTKVDLTKVDLTKVDLTKVDLNRALLMEVLKQLRIMEERALRVREMTAAGNLRGERNLRRASPQRMKHKRITVNRVTLLIRSASSGI